MLLLVFTIVALTTGLTDNEAYYWSWSLRPALSYFDHPPLHAWTLWITGKLFSKSNFAIRVPALISFCATTYLYVRWAKQLRIPWQLAFTFCLSLPVLFVFSWISLPDILLIPLCLLTILLTSQRQYVFAGITLGLALLSKWHGILIAPGLICMVFVQEREFGKRLTGIILPMIISIIIQTPVLLWNMNNNWVSFKYHLFSRHVDSAPTIIEYFTRAATFWSSFFCFGGVVFIYLAYRYMKVRRKSPMDSKDFALLSLSLPFIVIFFLSTLKGQYRIYWTSFSYFPLSLFLLRHLEDIHSKKVISLACRSCLALVIILLSTIYLPIGAYLKPIVELVGKYDIRFSPAGDFSGWDKWSQKEVKLHLSPDTKSLFLASDIRLASQLLWHSDLALENVHVLKPIKQFSIWERPQLDYYSNIVFYGDNRRKIKKEDAQGICNPVPHPQTKIYLRDELIKTIDHFECRLN